MRRLLLRLIAAASCLGVLGRPPLLLKGTCSLAFEGQEFTPASAQRRDRSSTWWLSVSDEVRAELVGNLCVEAFDLEFLTFEAEFLGYVHQSPAGAGHFGMYPGSVTVVKVTAAKLHVPERSGRYRSIREALRATAKPQE